MKIPVFVVVLSIAACAYSTSAQEPEPSRSISPHDLVLEPLESSSPPDFIAEKTLDPRTPEPVSEWGSRPGDRKFARRRIPANPTYYYVGPSHGPIDSKDSFNFIPIGGAGYPGEMISPDVLGRRYIVNPDSSVTFLD